MSILKIFLNVPISLKMVYLEGMCMVEADTHVVWDEFNTEGPKGPALCPRGCNTIECCQLEIRGESAHVSSFVLISILRGQPRTSPSGDNLGALDYHLNSLPKTGCLASGRQFVAVISV